MGNIRFFLKFGKKEHMESLVEGNLYCSNAQTFWGIEDNLKIRGQGDGLEASTVVHGQTMFVSAPKTNKVLTEINQAKCIARIDPAKTIPVFCLFTVFEEERETDDCGNIRISLSQDTKNMIKEHFPNADSVVIIDNPQKFIEDVKNSIGHVIKGDLVHYYYIDEGIQKENGNIAMDLRYIMYLTQDEQPLNVNGNEIYSLSEEFAYRVLFCKDVFFEEEREFRFVLPEDHILMGTSYPVNLTEEYKIEELEAFIREH